MLVTRNEEAQVYEAPNHRLVRSVRLQGFKQGGPVNQWVGLSVFAPGGGAGPDSSPIEKVYVILQGEMTVIIGGQETTLRFLDSCTIPAGEVREIVNRTDETCMMLVIMPYPPGVAA